MTPAQKNATNLAALATESIRDELTAGNAAGKVNWAAILKILLQMLPLILPLFLTEDPEPPKPA